MTRQKNYALTFQMYVADFEAERVEMDGGPDHVHLLINYHSQTGDIQSGKQPQRRIGRLLRRIDQILQSGITTKAFCGVWLFCQ